MREHRYRHGHRRPAWLILLSGLLTLILVPSQVVALNILLTNDDGLTAVGVQTLKDKLEAADHTVTLVAPSSNRGGSGASLSLGTITVTQQSPNEYAVDATPASCVVLGLEIIDTPPDLIVSGTNIGANIGAATQFSGTVGATIAATSSLTTKVSIPAIVVSTDAPVAEADDPAAFWAHFEQVADFTQELIAHLESKAALSEASLLPARIALNVNYPPLAPIDIQGVILGVQGPSFPVRLFYEESATTLGSFETRFLPVEDAQEPHSLSPDGVLSDSTAFADGFITIVPIVADYTASAAVRTQIDSLLGDLRPTDPASGEDCNGDLVFNGLDLIGVGCAESEEALSAGSP